MLAVRRTTDEIIYGIVLCHNLEVRDRVANATTYPHADVTSTRGGYYQAPTMTPLLVTAPTANSTPTTIALAENLRAILLVHVAEGGTADNMWAGAHEAADDTALTALSVDTVPTATSIGTAETLLNAIKAAYNDHLAESGVHFTDDSTNDVSTTDAIDPSTAYALANALKAAVNLHIQFAGSTSTLNIVAA